MYDILPKWYQTREFAALWRARRPSISQSSLSSLTAGTSLPEPYARTHSSHRASGERSRQGSTDRSLGREGVAMTDVPALPPSWPRHAQGASPSSSELLLAASAGAF